MNCIWEHMHAQDCVKSCAQPAVFSPPSEVAIQRVASLFIEKYPAKMDEARVEDGVHCSLTQSIKESGRRRQHGFSCAG